MQLCHWSDCETAEFTPQSVRVLETDIRILSADELLMYQLLKTGTLSFQDPRQALQNTAYSVIVTKLEKIKEETITESICISDFTRLEEKARQFYELLHQHLVTPCTLEDVADDWLGA